MSDAWICTSNLFQLVTHIKCMTFICAIDIQWESELYIFEYGKRIHLMNLTFYVVYIYIGKLS